MKLAISNLSWESHQDDAMFPFLLDHGIALEVAPTRIFRWEESRISGRMISPYERLEEARDWYRIVNTHYNITVASMQSLLYNVEENLFASGTWRRYLTEYLKSAIRFAVQLQCPNLCFGCARNRRIPSAMSDSEAGEIILDFFGTLADYAEENGVCFSIEPLPVSTGTNFITDTQQAFDLARQLGKACFRVNVDTGTIIENGEDIHAVFTKENLPLIRHIHLSEPGLAPLRKRDLFTEISGLLHEIGYEHYVSVEMLKFPDVKLIQGALNYFSGLF